MLTIETFDLLYAEEVILRFSLFVVFLVGIARYLWSELGLGRLVRKLFNRTKAPGE